MVQNCTVKQSTNIAGCEYVRLLGVLSKESI